MESLNNVIEKLKSHNDVDAVFLTGSNAINKSKLYSDIDLVVILNTNKNSLYSLYRWTEGVFTEVFFFDLKDIERILSSKSIDSDHFDAILLDWIKKSHIYFDKSGILTKLKIKSPEINISNRSIRSKEGFLQRINHNYITDKRYFESKDPIYHEALEIKLFYSMEQIICAYFAFRDIPWRGEKNAILYIKDNAQDFYKLFKEYTSTSSLTERFQIYSKMFECVFTDVYKKWKQGDILVLKKDFSVVNPNEPTMIYLKSLFD